MSNKNRNYQGNNGNQAQENTTPESNNQEQFEGEIPMNDPKKPEKPTSEKKGVKEAAKAAWETEHTITWSGKGVAKKVGGFLAAAAAGALAMWAWDRKDRDTSDEDYEDDSDIVAESEYREVSDTEA